jgi:thiamine pyrophosphokinase
LKTVIIANGELNADDLHRIEDSDLLIAADGGYEHCRLHGLQPAVIIGDLDSLGGEALDSFSGKVIRHPANKDETDLELALRYALGQGAKEIIILAGLGTRWDQTVANVMLLATASSSVRLIDGSQELFVLSSGEQAVLEAPFGSTVSLIPLSGGVHGVKTQGLQYPLDSESMDFGKTRGMSNIVVADPATVEILRGVLLCIIIWNGRENHDE